MTLASPAPSVGQEGAWEQAPSMRNARAAHAVVSVGDAIFALAGTGEGGNPVLEVERFDGSRWVAESSLPGKGLNAPAAAVLNGRIYLIGGFNTSTNTPTDRVEVYDPVAKSWSEAAPLPEPRGGHAAVVLNSKIHVIGGGNSQRTLEFHSAYDPANNTWIDLAQLPRSEGSPAATVLDGKIYAIGGRSGSSDFGDVYIYDPATDKWDSGPSISPRGTAGAVVYCGAIYVFGGESQAEQTSLNLVEWLDVASRVWNTANPMPTARNFARAVLFQDSVYVVGGSPTAGSSHSSEGSAVVERFRADCPQRVFHKSKCSHFEHSADAGEIDHGLA